ncbi:unnamed protein product, partial [Prorocentrum cordatum]
RREAGAAVRRRAAAAPAQRGRGAPRAAGEAAPAVGRMVLQFMLLAAAGGRAGAA